jgi:putative NADH-flavin reductase
MRIALLGGTGRIGGHLLAWAVESGHQVNALARDPAVLTVAAVSAGSSVSAGNAVAAGSCGPAGVADRGPGPGLSVVAGDVTDAATVTQVIAGADAVLSALGPRGAKSPGLLGVAGRNIVAAMQATGVSRLICVSAAGAFIQNDPDCGPLIKLILPRVLAKPFADVRVMEQVVAGSDLDWTLVRATRLVNTPQTGKYRVRPDYPPLAGVKISRADVAHFIGSTLTNGDWVHGRPALAY